MKLFIADRNRLTLHHLPEKIDDVFSVSYQPIGLHQDVLLVFGMKNDQFIFQSNGMVEALNGNQIYPAILLSLYQPYPLKLVDRSDGIKIYLLPEQESYKAYTISTSNTLTIGNQKDAIFQLSNFSVQGIFASISFRQKWVLEASNSVTAYVNNQRVTQAILKLGDVIFIEGLRIIFMGTYVEVNNYNSLTVATTLAPHVPESASNSQYENLTDDERNVQLYKESDYFYHIPRLREVIEEKEVSIDAPPSSEKKDEAPLILTIGSTITMSASSLMMGWNVGYGLLATNRTIWAVIPQIVMCLSMLVGSLIIPRLASRYQKKKAEEREQLRLTKYREYLAKKDNELNQIIHKQYQIMHDNAISVPKCLACIKTRDRLFWSREIKDDDFLSVRLGLGDTRALLSVQAPEEHFTLDEDDLLNEVYNIVERHKTLDDVPITFSFTEHPITAFILNIANKKQYLDEMILQLSTLHSALDLKIALFTNSEKSLSWDYMRFLPHCFSEDKSQRFFATNLEEAKEVSNYIGEVFKARLETVKGNNLNKQEGDTVEQDPYKNFPTYYLLITDDYAMAKNVSIFQDLMKYEKNYGFSILIVEDSLKMLPARCSTFVQIDQKDGAIIDKQITSQSQTHFKVESNPQLNMREISMTLANIPIVSTDGLSELPNVLPFLEMFGVSRIELLNIVNRWRTNNPVTSLSATIGVHKNGDSFKLDLHEKFHGPHGLIAGSTGSGKSEFIITYILSLAVNYDPREVQFVLIDYKGGGLAGAFENKETGVRIPHLIGTITNLDTNEMNRTLVSIESELKRRQRVFNEVKDALGEGTIDIYKYQKLFREGQVKEPMAHLFIISDEFAELKSQQPEFMAQLISTARIGRSLGVHLILATQKPSGIVNDQIWSNSKFKVCLRVQDRSDSMEVLKKPDAASIRDTGRFYLQVGYDDIFELGQSGWAGAKYVPSDRLLRKIDDSLVFVNHVGYPLKSIKDVVSVQENSVDLGDQLTNLVKYLYDLGNKEQIKIKSLWLEKIPPVIYLANLRKKYQVESTPYLINPVIGEYDNPNAQEQGIVQLDFTNKGNLIVYGASGSGKENLLTTLTFSMVTEHVPDEVNIYILDFGSGALRTFNKIPHVGEVVSIDDSEKLVDTLKMIDQEIEKRKDLFADYGGSYVEYCTNSGHKLPLLVTIINNYDTFVENYPKISEQLVTMYRDGSKYGIDFVITAVSTNALRQRIVQNFNQLICLQIPNEGEYRSILGAPKGLFPLRYFGRGLVAMNDTAYEFQTALVYERSQINNIIRQLAERMQQTHKTSAKKVPSVPKVVSVQNLITEVNRISEVPIGYNIQSKDKINFNFDKNPISLVLTNQMDDRKISFFYALIKMMTVIPNTNVRVIDFVKAFDKPIEGVVAYRDNFDDAIIQMNNEVVQNRDNGTNYIYFILGIGELKNMVSKEAREVLNHLFSAIETYPNSKFIFIDLYASLKNVQIEPWYKGTIDNSCGIWLGAEAGSQMAINITNLSLEDRSLNYEDMGFVVDGGKGVPIKHMIDEEVLDEK